MLARGHAAHRRAGDRPRAAGRDRARPAAEPLRPGPLSARRRSRELVRERLGADADPAFCAACHEATGGNPLLLRAASARARGRRGLARRAANADVVREVGPRAVSSAVLLRLARLPATRPCGRAGGGGARRGRAAAGDRGARRARRGAGGRGDGRAGARRDPAARPAARLRPPARARRRLPRAPARRARAAARARGARCCATPARQREQIAAQLLLRRRRAGRPGWPSCSTRPAARRCTRARPRARCAYLRRALDEPPPRRAPRAGAARARARRGARGRPGGGGAPARGLRRR